MRIKPYYFKKLCRSLGEYKIHEQAIRDAEARLRELDEETETGVGGIDYGKDYVLSSTTGSVVEHIAISRAEMEAYYEHQIRSRKDAANLIRKALGQLEEDERKIIVAMYCNGKSWDQIEMVVHASRRTCIRRRDSGMGKMALYLYGEVARQNP